MSSVFTPASFWQENSMRASKPMSIRANMSGRNTQEIFSAVLMTHSFCGETSLFVQALKPATKMCLENSACPVQIFRVFKIKKRRNEVSERFFVFQTTENQLIRREIFLYKKIIFSQKSEVAFTLCLLKFVFF
jgi:hypothetical protein